MQELKAFESKRRYVILLVIAAFVFLVVPWMEYIPGDIVHIDIINLMTLAGIYACVAIGLNLLVGYAGQISLGHAAFFGIGAYTTAILCTRFSWFPPWIGVILGGVLAGAIGWLVGVPVLRLKGHYLAMATLGLGEIAYIVFRQWSGLTGGTKGIVGIPPLSFFFVEFDTNLELFFLVWAIVMGMMILSINIIRSRLGRSMRALHSSEDAADAMGVNTSRVKVKIFVLSAVFAGVGGAIYAHFLQYIDMNLFTFSVSILFITMVVVGGMGNVWGGLIGAVFLTFLPEVIRSLPYWIPGMPESLTNFSNYTLVLYGFLLIIFMMFMQKGIAAGLARGIGYLERRGKRIMDRARAKKYE